jgi:hypothetical protein
VTSKMTCPGCGSYTSNVLHAYNDEDPCPHCGLSAEATAEVLQARRRNADAELTKRYTEMTVRADRAEVRVRQLEEAIATMRRTFDEVTRGIGEEASET